MIECASCGAEVNVGKNPEMGKRFTCPSCHHVMEVVWVYPIELDWPVDDDDEDYEEDDEFEEDEFEEDEEEG